MNRQQKGKLRHRQHILSQRKTVYVSGTFDILHVGHIHLFEQARNYGNYLVVMVNTDRYVSSYKFKPIISQRNRKKLVSQLKQVDEVVYNEGIFDTKAYRKYGAGIKIEGSEKHKDPKSELSLRLRKKLLKYGVIIKQIPRIGHYSSTSIKNKIKED